MGRMVKRWEHQRGTGLFSDDAPDTLAQALEQGSTGHCVDSEGRRFLLTHNSTLGMPGNELAVIYEKRGVYFFPGDRPLNQFRLVEAGFSMMVADQVAKLVNAVIAIMHERASVLRIEGAPPRNEATGRLEEPTND
jgi:hypothetical protein